MRPLTAVGCVVAWALANAGPAGAQPPALIGVRLGGYIQARETFAEPTGLSATLNRARLSADGSLPNHVTYRMLVELEAGATARAPGTVSLREAIIRWTSAPYALQLGQFKAPFSREYLIPVPALETADFSAVVDSLAPKYEIGAMAEYALPSFGVWAGVFNGEGQNAGFNRDSTVLVVTRCSVRPLPQVTVAANVARGGPDSTRYGADLSLEQSGFLWRGEIIGQRKRGRSRDDFGWYLLGACRILPWLITQLQVRF